MSNTIEILDKDTKIKQTYVLKEKPEAQDKRNVIPIMLKASKYFLTLLAKFVKWSIQFTFYIAAFILEHIVKIIRAVFLEEYEPFSFVTDRLIERKAEEQIDEYRRKFATESLTKHIYKFERSKLYDDTYKKIQEKLKAFADNNVAINKDIYRDILEKIDILTVEVERKALQEGYSYASYTKYRLSDEEVFDDFIEYKVMRGEGQHDKANQEQRESTD